MPRGLRRKFSAGAIPPRADTPARRNRHFASCRGRAPPVRPRKNFHRSRGKVGARTNHSHAALRNRLLAVGWFGGASVLASRKLNEKCPYFGSPGVSHHQCCEIDPLPLFETF